MGPSLACLVSLEEEIRIPRLETEEIGDATHVHA